MTTAVELDVVASVAVPESPADLHFVERHPDQRTFGSEVFAAAVGVGVGQTDFQTASAATVADTVAAAAVKLAASSGDRDIYSCFVYSGPDP